jgi:hypothetical protein
MTEFGVFCFAARILEKIQISVVDVVAESRESNTS